MRRYGIHARGTSASLLVLAAAGIAVSGCGGGGKHRLTKAEVIEQGTAICSKAEQRVNELPEIKSAHPFAKGTSTEERAGARKFLAGYADALESSRQGLQKLDAPSEGRELLDAYLNGIRSVAEKLRAASAAKPQDVEPRANAAFALFGQVSKKTAAYGFPKGVCGSGSSS